jgi:dihydrolipoamide dehydrogenase
MSASAPYDLVVIGSGPGGYVAAIRAAQLGLKTAIVEKDSTLGGTCLNVGCIPSKALLESSGLYDEANKGFALHGIQAEGVKLDLTTMLGRKDRIVKSLTSGVATLMQKNKIDVARGLGRIAKPGQVSVRSNSGEETLLDTKRILIATGSVPIVIPGVVLDGTRVGTSTEALTYAEVPKHLVIIGAGVIGLELGSVWKRLGAEVTVVEFLDRILAGMDAELATAAQRSLQKQGLKFVLGARVTSARTEGDEAVITYTDKDGATQVLKADRALVAVGRKPYVEGLGARDAGVEINQRGQIVVNAHFETSVPGIFAIGDVIPGPMLAHKASEEGVAAVERMATGAGHVNYDAVPNVVYTAPEIASVGKTEEELKAAGVEYKKGRFDYAAMGRAKAIGHTEGFVKILADAKTDRVLGAHIIGWHAGDLIAEIALGIEFGTSSEDIGRATHAHPTLSEIVKEAALAVEGRALHGV